MKLTKIRWTELARHLGLAPAADPPAALDHDEQIHRLDLTVDAQCPCGSDLLHHLTLVGSSVCPRCGHTIAIRALRYYRPVQGLPVPYIEVGYIHDRRQEAQAS